MLKASSYWVEHGALAGRANDPEWLGIFPERKTDQVCLEELN